MDAACSSRIEVAICVVTYLRPIGLARCLESLAGLRFTEDRDVQPKIIVVDNDAAGSARAVVEQVAGSLPWPVRYEVEPQRGATFALNRAVALVGGCDYVALVDDDEFVEPAWLDELVRAQRRFAADVVTGPVLPVFEAAVPAWITKGRFFARGRYATGTPLGFARTGNALLPCRVLDRVAGPFDARFALTGGYDTFFFKQLARSGARLVWCDEAIVHEAVPQTRANLRWILQRGYRVGNTTALCERAMPAALRRPARAVWKDALVQIVTSLVKFPPSLLAGRAQVARRLREVAIGWGMVRGLLGRRYEEYRRIHGV